MTFNSIDDVPIREAAALIPLQSYRLAFFLEGATFHEIMNPSAPFSVTIVGGRPRVYMDLNALSDNIERIEDLTSLLFHEVGHLIAYRFSPARIGEALGIPELMRYTSYKEAMRDLGDVMGDTLKLMYEVLEMEVAHMEHVVLQDDVFHELTGRLFKDSKSPFERVLYRHSGPFEDPIFQQIHDRIFSDNKFSIREAFRLLKMTRPPEPPQKKGLKQSLESGIEATKDKDKKAIKSVLQEVEAEINQGGKPQEREGTGSSRGSGTNDVSYTKGMDLKAISHDLSVAMVVPDVSRKLRDGLQTRLSGGDRRRSSVPDFMRDRKAPSYQYLGVPQFYFRSPAGQDKLARFYFDVSGSQRGFIDVCCRTIIENKDLIHPEVVLFASRLKTIDLQDLIKSYETGEFRRGSVNSMGLGSGTNFDIVLDEMNRLDEKVAVVLSDNQCYNVARNTDTEIVLLLTNSSFHPDRVKPQTGFPRDTIKDTYLTHEQELRRSPGRGPGEYAGFLPV